MGGKGCRCVATAAGPSSRQSLGFFRACSTPAGKPHFLQLDKISGRVSLSGILASSAMVTFMHDVAVEETMVQ